MKKPILSLLSVLSLVSLSLSSSLISGPLHRSPFESLIANGSITSLDDIAKFHLSDLNTVENINYQVPNTAILLRFALHPGSPIDRAALGRTILTAQRSLRQYIQDNGDAYLDDADDPYEVDDRRTGKCMIGMKSTKKYMTGDERLRYGRVLDTFQGLFDVLYLARRCYVGIFQIEDGGEVVGTGKVLVGNVNFVASLA
ncbi:MAG: hypothetical protein L6R37_007220 [Teloschistes peruensis]|nr:MAG: hypothetical protein L6R37_007220 [Teloschistes peruensis]